MLEFRDSDIESQSTPATTLVEVSESTLLSKKFASRSDKAKRLKTRTTYALPRVVETKTPKLDRFMRAEVSPHDKAISSWGFNP